MQIRNNKHVPIFSPRRQRRTRNTSAQFRRKEMLQYMQKGNGASDHHLDDKPCCAAETADNSKKRAQDLMAGWWWMGAVIFGAVDKSGMGQPSEYCDLWPLVECKQHCTKYSYKGSQDFACPVGFQTFKVSDLFVHSVWKPVLKMLGQKNSVLTNFWKRKVNNYIHMQIEKRCRLICISTLLGLREWMWLQGLGYWWL